MCGEPTGYDGTTHLGLVRVAMAPEFVEVARSMVRLGQRLALWAEENADALRAALETMKVSPAKPRYRYPNTNPATSGALRARSATVKPLHSLQRARSAI